MLWKQGKHKDGMPGPSILLLWRHISFTSVPGYVRTLRYTSYSRCWTTRHLFLPTRWYCFLSGHVWGRNLLYLSGDNWYEGEMHYYGSQISHITQCVVTLKAFCMANNPNHCAKSTQNLLLLPRHAAMLANTQAHAVLLWPLPVSTKRTNSSAQSIFSTFFFSFPNTKRFATFRINNTDILYIWYYFASMSRATHPKARECLAWVRSKTWGEADPLVTMESSEGTTPRSEETPRTGTQTL
jgi:hypothetical protein